MLLSCLARIGLNFMAVINVLAVVDDDDDGDGVDFNIITRNHSRFVSKSD